MTIAESTDILVWVVGFFASLIIPVVIMHFVVKTSKRITNAYDDENLTKGFQNNLVQEKAGKYDDPLFNLFFKNSASEQQSQSPQKDIHYAYNDSNKSNLMWDSVSSSSS